MALNIRVKDATGAQIREHIGECTWCQDDVIMIYRRTQLRNAESDSMIRFWVAEVDARVEEMHRGSI